MAITECVVIQRLLYSDGTGTSLTINFVEDIATAPVTSKVISGTNNFSGGGTISSATVSGTKVTVTWSAAPSAGRFFLNGDLIM